MRWQSDEENPTVFYSFSFVNIPRITRSSSRYSIAPGNFSLMISDVNPGDERLRYRCLLGVEADLQNPTGRRVYRMAGNVDLSLIVASELRGREWGEGGREYTFHNIPSLISRANFDFNYCPTSSFYFLSNLLCFVMSEIILMLNHIGDRG